MLVGCCWESGKEILHSSMMKGVSYLIFFITLTCGIVPTASADVDAGLSWLADQSQADGSYTAENDIATSVQTTAETLRTFSITESEPAEATAGYTFLSDVPFYSTEYLSRKIIALVESGGDASALLSELEGLQQPDGSFSELPGYDSTVLDTAFAVEAFTVAGRMSSNPAALAVSYLFNRQNSDGGWGHSLLGSNSESSVYVTSLVLNAIAPYQTIYNLETSISNAQSYLLGKREGNNLWGETFISAQSLIALVASLSELDQITDSLSKLRESQFSNGSWEDDVYTTALALRALKLAALPPNAPALAGIKGIIIDADTQLPLEGVGLTLVGAESQSKITGANGSFSFINLPAGNYSLEISLADYATVSSTTSLSPGQLLDYGTIQMAKQAQATTGTIRGTITDSSTGSGLAGVTVTVSGGNPSVVTDSGGNFQIASVQPGSISVQASKSGYSTASGSVNIVAGGIYIFSPALTPVAANVTELRGTVTDSSTGQPIANASVSVTGASTTSIATDAQGGYQITGLNPGDITIVVSATDYDSVTASTTVYENNIIEFSPALYPTGSTPPGVNTAGVKGVVVDATTNLPLRNVLIKAVFGTQTQTFTTDSDGLFEFTGIVDTQGSLQFNLIGYKDVTVDLTLTPLATLDVGQIGLVQDEAASALPDLIVKSIDVSSATTDIDTLELSGSVTVAINNQGTVSVPQAVTVLAFYDNNKNGTFDADVDISLGTAASLSVLDVGANETVEIPVSGVLPYRDAPIKVWVDSIQSVIESNEQNNIDYTANACQISYCQWPSDGLILNLEFEGNFNDSTAFQNHAMVDSRSQGVAQTVDDGIVGEALSLQDGLAWLKVPNSESLSVTEAVTMSAWVKPSGRIGNNIGVYFKGELIGQQPDWQIDLNDVGTGGLLGPSGVSTSINGTGYSTSEVILVDYDFLNPIPYDVWSHVAVTYDRNELRLYVNGTFVKSEPWANPINASGTNLYIGNRFQPTGNVGGFQGLMDELRLYNVALSAEEVSRLATRCDAPVQWSEASGGNGHWYKVVQAPEGVSWEEAKTLAAAAGGYLATITSAEENDFVFDLADDPEFWNKGNSGANLGPWLGGFQNPTDGGTANNWQWVNSEGSFEFSYWAPFEPNDRSGLDEDYLHYKCEGTCRSKVWNDYPNTAAESLDGEPIVAYVVEFDELPKSNIDLTSAQLSFFTRGDGSNQLTALIGNAGSVATPSGTQISFYEGDPNAGGTLLGSVDLPQISGDSSQNVTLENVPQLVGGLPLYVVADSTNIVSECNEDNNTAWTAAPDLLPDLIVDSVDASTIQFNEQTLELSGTVSATISNQGNTNTGSGFKLYAFFDADHDDAYEDGVDILLGRYEHSSLLDSGSSIDIAIDITGVVTFRDSPITVWVDSDELITESHEQNNTGITNHACYVQPEIGTLEPTVKWSWHSSSATAGSTGNGVLGPAMVGQLTDDNSDGLINKEDIPDVVFMSTSSTKVLNVVSGSSGEEVWSVAGDFATYGSVALGDIDSDGIAEIVVSNSRRTILKAYEHTGELKWSVSHGPTHGGNARDGIALADLDSDGVPEIVTGRRAYSNQGVLLWEGSGDYGGTISYGVNSLVADVDLDGSPEVVAGRTLYDANGNTIWHAIANSDGFNAVGNFDDDDFAEIVLVASGNVYLLEHTGSIKWGPIAIPGGGVGGAPTVADMDGDDLPEIGVAGASRYMVLEHDGTVKWTKPTQDASSHRTGSSVFDFEGDGKAEVVYSDEQYLFIYDGTTGAILEQIPSRSGTTLEYPVIADIDNDGHAELLVGVDRGSSMGLFAYESVDDNWVATRNIWNQHTYHITNINDDGTVPSVEQHSWLSHNTYRLNTFVDRDPRAVADLTATALRVIDNGAGQPVNLQVRIGNGGLSPSPSNVKVSFYSGNPATGGTLLGTTTMAQLDAYEYRDVVLEGITLPADATEIFAFVDSDEQVTECNETNNTTSTVVSLSILGDIAVATDAPVYGPNRAVILQSIVTNAGALSGEFIAELMIEDQQGVVISSYSGIGTGILSSGAAFNHNEGWNTGTYLVGPYVLHGILRTPDGQIIDEDKTIFNIQHNGATLAVSLRTSTDKPVYHTTDTIQIEDLVQNLTVNMPVTGSTLKLQVRDPSGVLIYEKQHPLSELLPRGQRTLMDAVSLSSSPEGNYQVTGVILSSSGVMLASDTATFSVQENLGIALTGTVTAQYPELYQGDTQVCTDKITNTGILDITALRIQQLVVNIDTQEQIGVTELTRNVASGSDTIALRSLDTTAYEMGDHACILQAEVNGEWKTLDYVAFKVIEPPIKLDSTIETGALGRLLVLLDDDKCGCWKLPPHGGHLYCEDGYKHGCDHRSKVECFNQIKGWLDHKDHKWNEYCDQLCTNSCGEKGVQSTDVWVQGSVVAKGTPNLSFEHKQKKEFQLGGFKLTGCDAKPNHHGGHGSECDNDPYGPKDAPKLSDQRAYLEALLKAEGWSYTIVTDAESFTRELRSGGYQVYALFNERVKLPEQVQKELREAVHRGDGLLVAGNHDERNGRLNDTMGIRWHGHSNYASGVLFADSPLQLSGEETFTYADKTARIDGSGVDIIANFITNKTSHTGGFGFGWPWKDSGKCGGCDQKLGGYGKKQHKGGSCDDKWDKCGHDKKHGDCDDKPDIAVTSHDYGQGRAMYAAFDLLAHATAAGDASKLADLIRNSLQHVHPQNITPIAGGVVPVTITLTNQGMATPGQVVITLPDGSEVVDPGVSLEGDDNKLIWTFDLAEDQEMILNFWLRLPETVGPISIDTLIQTGIDPDFQDYETLNLIITSQQRGDLTQVLTELEALKKHNHRFWPVSMVLHKAERYLEKGYYCKTLKYLIMATDKLIRIDHEKAEEVRLQVDWVIWDVSRKLWAVILQTQSEQSETGKGCDASNKHKKSGKECKR